MRQTFSESNRKTITSRKPVSLLSLFCLGMLTLSCFGHADAFQRVPRQARISPLEKRHANVKKAFESIASKATAATVRVFSGEKQVALGTIVDQSGLIVTKATLLNDHLACQTQDGTRHDARLLETNREFDLAVLKIDATNLASVSFADTVIPQAASWLVSVGATQPVLSIGVASSEPRKFNLRENVSPSRGFLGVMVQPDPDGGVEIIQIVKKSSAESAGLSVGDIIVRANSRKLIRPEDLVRLLSEKKPGDQVELLISRDEEEPEEKTVKLGKIPAQSSVSPYDRWGGGPFSQRRFSFPRVLPHDGLLKPNQCGGPVLDSDGNFVGINISRALRISTYTILADDIKRIVDHAKANRD